MFDSHILVAGDVPVDLLVYSSPNPGLNQRDKQKLSVRRCSGGATLISDLLFAATDLHKCQIHPPAVSKDTFLESSPNAITELEIFGEAVEAPFGFKVKHRQPLDTKPRWYPASHQLTPSDNLDVLIFQDAEQHFNKSDIEVAVDLFRDSRPRVLLYHMALPLGVGALWDAVRRGPYGKDRNQDPEKLIVVVSADDLRAEGIELSHGLSWEKTCEDFVENLGSNGKLDTLVTCANLIVLFGCDGVIYHRGRQMLEPTLFFDPLSAEGRFIRRNIGPVPGLVEAFIAGLATKIAQSPEAPLDDGIKYGFSAARHLAKSEIEAFRTMFNAIHEYLSTPQTKPLNIGIFGSRGSGKSFAAVQVANAASLACRRENRHFRFNLSQFTKPEDLSLAFNMVRDCTLSGTLPIVYINGFDTELSGEPLSWLTYLLPPMHSGHVFDHGEMRHTGNAIFLLGSKTTTSLKGFQEFSKPKGNNRLEVDENMRDNELTPKAEEFLSCLHSFVDVLGIDQVNKNDALYPVRRAVVLQALLEEREPRLQTEKGISIDEGVLDGLLMIPTYRHGLRSLKSIISMSKITGKRHFERAALPPAAQLALHLDYDNFMKYSHFDTLPDTIREVVSELLHETYVNYRETMEVGEELRNLKEQDSAKPWMFLSEELKESARAHAAEIPRKLRTISCFLAEEDENRTAVTEFTKKELDRLAEEEHERWNAERLKKQWHFGPRDVGKRSSPFLIPWRDLEKRWQDVDRAMVESYPKILPDGYKIYRIGKATKTKVKVLPGRVTTV
ncbi:hypothetical protein B7494_g2586 [Chlorociboria aeruginascens]|nr:hypothetical protein B7494_g2586 [Chlorociboria aeruginascens]